jgi:hypothetical protein
MVYLMNVTENTVERRGGNAERASEPTIEEVLADARERAARREARLANALHFDNFDDTGRP